MLEGGNAKEQIQFRAATVVDAEGAYFFNKYVGIGGRFRVRAMSAKSFGQYAEGLDEAAYLGWLGMVDAYDKLFPNDHNTDAIDISDDPENPFPYLYNYMRNIGFHTANGDFNPNAPVTDIYGIVKSDHLTEFTASLGLYFNIPLSKRFSIGTKALIGRSFTQELDIDGYAEGYKMDINYLMTMKPVNGQSVIDLPSLEYPKNLGERWTDEWDYLTLGASSSTSYGTGISLTYKYKSNFSWRLFCDYDYTKKEFTLKHDPLHFMQKGLTSAAYDLMRVASEVHSYLVPVEYKKTKKMNYFTLGLSFLVNL